MKIFPRRELMRQMELFFRDTDRGISKHMFSEICGISEKTLDDVFIKKTVPMSDRVQVWVSKALAEWEEGKVLIKRRPNGTKYIEYQRDPQPQMKPHTGLKFTADGFKLDIGMKNRGDYSAPTLIEQMKVR